MPAHHVGVCSAWHALTGVQIQKLVNLRGSQSISHLQLLNDKHLTGNRLFAKPRPLRVLTRHSRQQHRVGLMLETDLKKQEIFTDLPVFTRGSITCSLYLS